MSQRVWTCACGWRSTAENVGGNGRPGEAPPHCRRCGATTTFTVTSERYPKVTHVCKGCRADFIGHVGAKFCETCRPRIRGQLIWEGRRKYIWTPERDQLLRDHYRNNATAFARRYFPDWPKWVITHRAQALGLARTKEKLWTKAEDAFLLEWVGTHTPQWMQRQLRTHTVTAIIVRLKRLRVSRRIQADGLTMRQLEQALGVDHRQLAAWWKSGRLKGIRRDTDRTHDPYVFADSDVAEFVLANPLLFRLDRVDQVWFMGLMREAVRRGGSSAPLRDQPALRDAERRRRPQLVEHSGSAAAPHVPCIGVDPQTACVAQKRVVSRPGIPPRCPDCMLEFRRRRQLDEQDRLRRIRASAPPSERSA